MKKYLRAFKTQAEYLAFTASTEFILDNVSSCREGDLVYYASEKCGGYVPPTPVKKYEVTAKFYVTDTSNPTRIGYNDFTSGFSSIEIDGVELQDVTSAYTFSTTGEHTVKYKLANSSSTGKLSLSRCYDMTSCTIDGSVTSIDQQTFSNCSGLTSVTIPNSVTSIGFAAFNGCSGLTSINIPNGVTTIGHSVFLYCNSLTSVTMGDNVTSFEIYAFNKCENLKRMNSDVDGVFNLPSNLRTIGTQALQDCKSLVSLTIPNKVTSIGNYAISYCSNLTSVTIPNSVTNISDGAFTGCRSLTGVTVNAVTPPTLGNDVFHNTNNCPIYVPCDSVDVYKAASGWSSYASRIQAIPGDCVQWDITANFQAQSVGQSLKVANDISNIKAIQIDGVRQENVATEYQLSTYKGHIIKYSLIDSTSVGDKTFLGCSEMMSCDIGSGVINIGVGAFNSCSILRDVTIPDGVISIGDSAFLYCNALENVNIPDSVTSIGNHAFGVTSVESVVIPSGVTSIENHTFWGCGKLTSVTIPDSVINIGVGAFSTCSGLTSVDIPNSVVSIGASAFSGCRSLTSIEIPSGVTSIGVEVVSNCYNLVSITVDSNNTVYDSRNNCNAIIETSSNTLIAGCKSTIVPSTVTNIGRRAFLFCYGLTNIVIPDNVTEIDEEAFWGCSGLTSCTIGSGLININTFGFAHCSKLTSITCNATTAPTIRDNTFRNVGTNGTLYVPIDSSGYNEWMKRATYYLGYYNWTKVEQ